MDAAHDTRRQLGQLMVDEGFLTADQLEYALGEQNRTGRPLGKILVELGFVSEGAVANALAEQHGGLLRTEYGTSAGLHAVPDEVRPSAPIKPRALDLAPPQSDPLVARNAELEAQVQSLLAERNTLIQRLNELVQQAPEPPQPEVAEEHAHLLYFPAASGYSLLERPGPAPASGTLFDLDGAGFVARRVGRSPLPGDRLRCVFLERL